MMLTKMSCAVVGFWLWQEETDCPNAAVCCPFLCSVSYCKCQFTTQVIWFSIIEAFLLSPFAVFHHSFLISVSFDLFTSSLASSLWASCLKPRPTSLIWPLIWNEGEDDDTALYATFPLYAHSFIHIHARCYKNIPAVNFK